MSITGTNTRAKNIMLSIGLGIVAVIVAFLIVMGGVPTAGALVIMPFAIAFAALCIGSPYKGLILFLHLSFFSNGLYRFFPPELPYGLILDAILGLCLIGTIFQAKREDLRRLNNPMFVVVLAWAAYCFFQVSNPEARSREAWFFAVRGVALYWVQVVPLVFIWMHRPKDLDKFIRIWLGWSVIAALWAFKQQYIGLTAGEQKWIDDFAGPTHVLMGKLRSFSFYSDAGQFGAAMAHVTLFCMIMMLGTKQIKKKVIYLILTLVLFWGFAVTGSRGPLFVIAGGFLVYLFMIKNFKILAVGLIGSVTIFVILKYTFIGQGNYQVQRLRSALDPQDPSLLVRLENQRKLRSYLASRPLGGGIGAGGAWGKRFSPGSFLAESELDSWYVKIWVETGVVGLWIHILQILIIIFFGFKKVFFLRDDDLRNKCMALLCGFVGISIASYGNQIFGQTPTSTIIYFSMVFFYLCGDWDKEIQARRQKEKTEPEPVLKPQPNPNLLW